MRLAVFLAVFFTSVCVVASSYASIGEGAKLPVWFDKDGLTKSGENAVLFLKTSEDHGIDSERYNIAAIDKFDKTRNSEKLLEINNQITHSTILYLLDLKYGVQGKKNIFVNTNNKDLSKYKKYFTSVLAGISKTKDFKRIVTAYVDEEGSYWKLQNYLAYLQELKKSPVSEDFNVTKSIKLGDSNAELPLLRTKLAMVESLHSKKPLTPISNSPIYDEELVEKVKYFQKTNGLSADGVIGKKTTARLNGYIPFAISQVKLTLDKIRSDDDKLLGKHVIINIPAFELTAFSDGKREFSMPVIIGKKTRETPEFSNQINRVVFNPEWFPTKRIVREDLLPKMRNNPSYFAKGGYKVIWKDSGEQIVSADHQYIDWNSVHHSDVRIVQSKGRSNALGVVKFLMPNNDSIYMHDTNNKSLFKKSYRALSSGCIRLSDPMKMASFAFNGDKIGNKTIKQIVASSAKKYLNTDNGVKVKTIYHTAWVDEDGKLQIRDDVYGKSGKFKLALKRNKLSKAIASISPTYPSSNWASVEVDEFASLVLSNTP